MSLFIATTIGGTKYFDEWLASIINLKPSIIIVAKDIDRSEPLKEYSNLHVLEYSSGKKWESYEQRHLNFESDYSILLGMIKLIEYFINRNETHFLHIDSDIIVDKMLYHVIYPLSWDYLQFKTPVIPREAINITHVSPIHFCESSNFGISKIIAQKILNKLYGLLNEPYPIDIKIHKLIREINPQNYKLITTGISHYIRGKKYTI